MQLKRATSISCSSSEVLLIGFACWKTQAGCRCLVIDQPNDYDDDSPVPIDLSFMEFERPDRACL